ncbi:hypothetical protein Tco_0832018 [Tanacetum coccineum]
MEEKARYAMIGLEKAGQEEEWDAIIDLLNDYRFPVEDESMDVDTFNTTKASINFHMNTQEYVIHVEAASTTIQPEDLQEANLESASFKPASVVAAQSKPAQLELAQSKTAIVEPASKKKARGDSFTGIKRRRRDPSSDGVRDLVTASGRSRKPAFFCIAVDTSKETRVRRKDTIWTSSRIPAYLDNRNTALLQMLDLTVHDLNRFFNEVEFVVDLDFIQWYSKSFVRHAFFQVRDVKSTVNSAKLLQEFSFPHFPE